MSDQEVTLYARVTVCGGGADISLNRKVTAALWDNRKLLGNQKTEIAVEINQLIDLKRGEIRDCYYQLKAEKKILLAVDQK